MKPCIPSFIFRSAMLALLVFQSLGFSQAQQENTCGDKAEQEKKEVQLRGTVEELIGAIRTKNGSALLKFVDKKGIYLWGGLLSQENVREEINHKDGIYCLFFSTDCLASIRLPSGAYVNSSKWTISYSEWLERHSPTKIETEMFYGGEDDPCTANVAIRSLKDPSPDQLTFEIGFDYRNGYWKLRSTPAWPEGIALLSATDEITQQQIEASVGNEL